MLRAISLTVTVGFVGSLTEYLSLLNIIQNLRTISAPFKSFLTRCTMEFDLQPVIRCFVPQHDCNREFGCSPLMAEPDLTAHHKKSCA